MEAVSVEFKELNSKLFSDIELIKNHKYIIDSSKKIIIQFLGEDLNSIKFDYRRFKLNRFISNNLNVQVIPIVTDLLEQLTSEENILYFKNIFSKANYIIISSPKGLSSFIKLFPKHIKIFYDKSDFWQDAESDILACAIADKISCSAMSIYKDLISNSNWDCKLIANGTDSNTIEVSQQKLSKFSIIYSGIKLIKLDINRLCYFAEKHKDIDIYLFCDLEDKKNISFIENHNLKSITNIKLNSLVSYKDMIKFMSKCHAGFIFHTDAPWSQGMFSLKVWDYLKCGIPCYYSNSINYAEYDGDFCFNADNYSIEDVINNWKFTDHHKQLLEDNKWENKFRDLIKFYELEYLYKEAE